MSARARERTERRSALLASLLPGLAIVLVYAVLVRPAIEREREELQKRVETARRSAPALPAESELQRRVETRREEVRARQEEITERVRAVELTRGAAGPALAGRSRRLAAEAIARLLAKHSLELTAEVSGDGRAGESGEAPARTPVQGEPRTLQFRGRYRDVLSALEELPQVAKGVEPLALSLRPPAHGEEVPRWTLVLR